MYLGHIDTPRVYTPVESGSQLSSQGASRCGTLMHRSLVFEDWSNDTQSPLHWDLAGKKCGVEDVSYDAYATGIHRLPGLDGSLDSFSILHASKRGLVLDSKIDPVAAPLCVAC